MTETSTKPYFIRALHEWCTDNGYTPYIAVSVDEHTVVPREHVQAGQITLNVGTLATNKLVMGNEYIEFQARFGGVSRQISVPVSAVRAVYARETGQGMAFDAPAPGGDASQLPVEPTEIGQQPEATEERPTLSAVPSPESQTQDNNNEPEDPPPAPPDPSGGRPRLKVIK